MRFLELKLKQTTKISLGKQFSIEDSGCWHSWAGLWHLHIFCSNVSISFFILDTIDFPEKKDI